MSDKHTPGRLYIRTNRHPNTDGTPWGWVDLHEPGSMLQASPDGIQVTWSRGQKSEANARRLVACWNACEGLPTAWIEGGAADILEHAKSLKSQRDELLEALKALTDRGRIPPTGLAFSKARAAIAKAEASE